MTPQNEMPPRAGGGTSIVRLAEGNDRIGKHVTRKFQVNWLSERGMDRRQTREFARLWFGSARDE